MSYTPDNQQIDGPLDGLLTRFEPVRNAITERLRNRDDWKGEHLDALEGVLMEMQALEIKLLKVRQGAL